MDLSDYRKLVPEKYSECLTSALVELLERLEKAGFKFFCSWCPYRKEVVLVRFYPPKTEGDSIDKNLETICIFLDAGIGNLPDEEGESTLVEEVDKKMGEAVWTFFCDGWIRRFI